MVNFIGFAPPPRMRVFLCLLIIFSAVVVIVVLKKLVTLCLRLCCCFFGADIYGDNSRVFLIVIHMAHITNAVNIYSILNQHTHVDNMDKSIDNVIFAYI